jgi:hypothetical protein
LRGSVLRVAELALENQACRYRYDKQSPNAHPLIPFRLGWSEVRRFGVIDTNEQAEMRYLQKVRSGRCPFPERLGKNSRSATFPVHVDRQLAANLARLE